jgi:Transglycosylase SLT domain
MTDYAKLAQKFGGVTDEQGSPLDVALNEEGISGEVADIARSIYQQESGSGKNTKTSNAGARGGMQIIPATFNRMADKGWAIDDPVHNARAGVRYISQLYNKADGDPALTAAGYYGGEGAINKAKKGIAVSDPRNPNAPNTLQYGQQVAARLPKKEIDYSAMASKFGGALEEATTQLDQSKEYTAPELLAMREQGVNIGALKMNQPTFKDDLQAEIDANPLTADYAAFGAPLSNAYEGAKQLFGKPSPYGRYGKLAQNNPAAENQQQIDANAQFADNSPIASLAGNVAMYAAGGVAAPIANTARGAAGMAGGIGFLNPVDADSTQDMLRQKAGNALLDAGIAGGATKGALAIGNKVLQRQAAKSLAKAQNATRDATTDAALDAGFNVPRSMYNPSMASSTIESIGGKAATKQKFTDANQKIVDSFARKSLRLSDDTALSTGAVEAVRKSAYKPYEEVAAISKGAANTLEDLKQARADATAWFTSYNRSANPEHLAKAKEYKAVADIADDVLVDYANKAGKPQLINELKQARKMIAKTYTVERAMNSGTGSIDSRVLGRLYEKGKPLSDGLDDVGRFATSFKGVAPTGNAFSGSDVSAFNAGLSLLSGAGGMMSTDSPYGAAAMALPFIARPAARKIAMSKLMQKAPNYNLGKVDYLTKMLTTGKAPVAIGAGAAPALAQQLGF